MASGDNIPPDGSIHRDGTDLEQTSNLDQEDDPRFARALFDKLLSWIIALGILGLIGWALAYLM